MNHREALNKTFDTFDISAAEVSRTSGVRETQISRFRRGKTDLYAETLTQLVNALPSDAKAYYYMLLLADSDRLATVAEGK